MGNRGELDARVWFFMRGLAKWDRFLPVHDLPINKSAGFKNALSDKLKVEISGIFGGIQHVMHIRDTTVSR